MNEMVRAADGRTQRSLTASFPSKLVEMFMVSNINKVLAPLCECAVERNKYVSSREVWLTL